MGYSRFHGGTIVRYCEGVLTGIAERHPEQPPYEWHLFQNYPNPFNPVTTIRYTLPRTMHAILSVYNLLGKQVATLVDRIQDAGVHEQHFDGSGLASGVFFYDLTAGEYLETKRFLLVR